MPLINKKKPITKPEERFTFGAKITPLEEGAAQEHGIIAQLDEKLPKKKLEEGPKNVSSAFEITEEQFQPIKTEMEKLPKDATREQKLDKLFELIRIGGTLGIEYEPSTRRGKSKTPNELLIPNKEGKLTGDCNELSLLFIASAKKLNVDISDVSVAVMKLETSPVGKDPMHAAVISRGDQKYLFDPAFLNKSYTLLGVDDASVSKAYKGAPTRSGKEILRVKVTHLASTPSEMLAINFNETAEYYETDVRNPYSKGRRASLRNMAVELENAVKLDPVSPEVKKSCYRMLDLHLDFIEDDLKSGNVVKAKAWLQELVKAADGLNKTYKEKGQEEFTDWSNKKMEDAYALFANFYYENKQYSKAIKWLDSVLLRNPQNKEALHTRTVCLLKTGKYAEAEREFKKLYSLTGDTQDILHLGMDVYYKTKSYEKVIKLAETAIALDKTDGRAYRNKVSVETELGRIAYGQGDMASALVYSKKAEKTALNALKNISRESPDYDKIKTQLGRVRSNIQKLTQ